MNVDCKYTHLNGLRTKRRAAKVLHDVYVLYTRYEFNIQRSRWYARCINVIGVNKTFSKQILYTFVYKHGLSMGLVKIIRSVVDFRRKIHAKTINTKRTNSI